MAGLPDTELLCLAIVLTAMSGVPGLFARRGTRGGERAWAALVAAGSLLGLLPAVRGVLGLARVSVDVPASPFPGASFRIAADALSSAFLVSIFLIGALGAVYGLAYWPERDHPTNGRRLRVSYGLLVSSMALVTIARSGILFLMAWEVMALSAFFAATAEDERSEVRHAGFRYLAATHTGSLALYAMVALLARAAGSFDWEPVPGATPLVASSVFLLALLGFGFKAGIVPLHFWLPGAHANAPSHVSALMSGLMLKMGVYGILRITSLLPAPPAWWGAFLLVVGLLGALSGAALAAAEDDLKRLLAYSSVENIGIVAMGIAVALLGRSAGKPALVVLGIAAAVLHVFNHSLFKSLLFFGAGAVLHASGTRRISLMGGLLRGMPRTALGFAAGCLAVCGLPPLNGFASEWLLYLGLVSSWNDGSRGMALAALAAAGLALVGGLAVAAFVKAFGLVFLGARRGNAGAPAHDGPAAMTAPMLALGAGCLLAGLLPWLLATPLDRVAAAWARDAALPPLLTVAPLGWLTAAGLALAVTAAAGGLVLAWRIRRMPGATALTWDCGYAAPAPSMQYTSGSFGDWIAQRLLPRSFRPIQLTVPPVGHFPHGASFSSRAEDPFFRNLYAPLLRRAGNRLSGLGAFQHGKLPIYLFYILATLVLALAWTGLRALLGLA